MTYQNKIKKIEGYLAEITRTESRLSKKIEGIESEPITVRRASEKSLGGEVDSLLRLDRDLAELNAEISGIEYVLSILRSEES